MDSGGIDGCGPALAGAAAGAAAGAGGEASDGDGARLGAGFDDSEDSEGAGALARIISANRSKWARDIIIPPLLLLLLLLLPSLVEAASDGVGGCELPSLSLSCGLPG
jgi:hypothetical protein